VKSLVGNKLTAHKAKHFTFGISCGKRFFKIFKISFYKDGFFLNLPYHPPSASILSEVVMPAGVSRIGETSLIPTGKGAENKFKYSHHGSGDVHFSGGKSIKTVVKRKSQSLKTSIGHIFTLSIQGAECLDSIEMSSRRDGEREVDISFDVENQVIPSVKFIGHWYHVDSLKDVNPENLEQSPLAALQVGGDSVMGFFISPPAGSPYENFVMHVSCQTIPSFNPNSGWALGLIAGFDKDEGVNHDLGFLVCSIPAGDAEVLKKLVEFIDYHPGTTSVSPQ
jgi:hypothetical protein